MSSSNNSSVLLEATENDGVIIEIGSRKPEFPGALLHKASTEGDVEMVKTQVGVDSQLCSEDNFSMNALQMAVVCDHVVVIKEQVIACPESFSKVSPQKETVFHLSAKHLKVAAFRVLFEEAEKLNQQHLLDEQDHQGNTVLHIAVSKGLLQIVKLLLLDDPSSTSSTTRFRINVNAINNEGHTAMDLNYGIGDRSSFDTKEIGSILQQAGGREAENLNQQQQTYNNRRRRASSSPPEWDLESKNVILVVLAIFIGLTFTVTCGLPTLFPNNNHVEAVYEFKDVITGDLPLIFYVMTFNTVLLITSTGILTVLLCTLPCGGLLLVGGIAASMLYILLAFNIMPKFFVKVGSHYVPSSHLMWMLALDIIFSGALMNLLAKCCLLRSHSFAVWLKRKLDANILSWFNNQRPPRLYQ